MSARNRRDNALGVTSTICKFNYMIRYFIIEIWRAGTARRRPAVKPVLQESVRAPACWLGAARECAHPNTTFNRFVRIAVGEPRREAGSPFCSTLRAWLSRRRSHQNANNKFGAQ
eukprot:2432226-Pleurochrysis_carterae.AAC.2